MVLAVDVLTGKVNVGDNVAIIGGGMVGCETAEFLHAKGKKAIIFEMLDKIAVDVGRTIKWVVRKRIKEFGIPVVTSAKVKEITESGVLVEHDGADELFKVDSVVIAAGFRENNDLANELSKKVANVHAIGDGAKRGRIYDAIGSGFDVGAKI